MTAQDLVIIGAGLSGLAIAHALTARGHAPVVLEARARPGGRVLSERGQDLGPAWIWPHNPRMLALTDALGLTRFAQHSEGRLVFEDATGTVRRDLDMATMGGALRVSHGMAAITDRLAGALPDGAVRLGHRVTGLRADGSGVQITGTTAEGGFELAAAQVFLALPPRLIAANIRFEPATDLQPLAATPTWMAGQAKLVAVYDRPFWRDAGLNGDAISHRGPLMEIHDASPEDAAVGALFGFVAPGAVEPDLADRAVAQLARLFGPAAGRPRHVRLQDWAAEPETATELDRAPPAGHPDYSPHAPLDGPWDRRVHFAGSEMAAEHGGFLEGALEAAEAATHAFLTGISAKAP